MIIIIIIALEYTHSLVTCMNGEPD